MVSLKIANDEHIKEEEDLVKENDVLKQEIVEINFRHIEEINNIRLVYPHIIIIKILSHNTFIEFSLQKKKTIIIII